MLVDAILDRARRIAPGTPALVTPRGALTFAELHARAERLAGALSELTRPGDRVALLSENRAEVVECYYGVPRAGTALVPLNWRLAPAELGALLADSEPRVLIGERDHLERISGHIPASVSTVAALDDGAGAAGTASAGDGYEALLARGADAPAARRGRPGHAAWIVYTSGTTGRPKGAILTHSNLWAGVVTGSLGRPVQPDDVYLFPFPLCHVAGYNVLVQHLHGRPVVLPGRFDPAALWSDVEQHGVTTMSLAPTMLAMLLDHGGHRAAGTSTLRTVSYGAAAMPAALLERAARELGCGFSQGYGMTELSGNVAFLGPEHHRRGLESEPRLLAGAGYPSPFVQVRVADEEGADVEPGEAGEVLVRGDQVTAGYWRQPAATAGAFTADGWFRTGDIGRMDPDGLLSIVDRKKDLIVTGGENVSSLEVEDALHRHPAVAAAAVVGVPDDTWGEAVCAVVVPAQGAEPGDRLAEELVEHCRALLASFKKPRHVVFVDDLPRNAGGKVLKAELRERLQRRWAGR